MRRVTSTVLKSLAGWLDRSKDRAEAIVGRLNRELNAAGCSEWFPTDRFFAVNSFQPQQGLAS